MKQYMRVLSLLLALVMSVAVLPLTASAAESVPVRGDCNDDGAVNLKDVLYLRRFLAGTVTEFPPHDCFGVNRALVRGDANDDGLVNMKDVLTLRKLMVGLISDLHFCSCQEEWAPHTVSVLGGSANVDEALPGETVFLTADMAEDGFVFDGWTLGGCPVAFDDVRSEITTFVMPNENVQLEARYVPITYTVFVSDGEADSVHPNPGDIVTVTARKPHSGETFDRWTVDGVTLDNPLLTTVSFVMPKNNVSLMALYCEE